MKIRLVFALALFSPFLSIAIDAVEVNESIRRSYCDTESLLISNVIGDKCEDGLSEERMLLELGYIRSKTATSLLLDRIAIPRKAYIFGKSSSYSPSPVESGGPLVLSAGPFSGLRDRYSSYKSLLRIGLPLHDSLLWLRQKENGNEVFMLACLAKLAADGYFDNLVITNARSWSLLPGYRRVEEIVVRSPRAKVFSTYECHGSQVAARYDAMQDTLIARFKSQLASGDAELADTIYTMGFIRSDRATPLLIDNLTVCPQISTNAPSGFVFPAAEALVSIAPPLGICFEKLEATAPMSLEESLWLRITHEDYPEALEYDLMKKVEAGDARAKRLLQALPWRRLVEAEMP